MPSRSRRRYCGASSQGNVSTTCCAVHCAVGCCVTLKCTMRRRSCTRITNTNSTLKVTVGTVKKSQETKSSTWLFRNALHGGEEGLRDRGRYFSTVDLAT